MLTASIVLAIPGNTIEVYSQAIEAGTSQKIFIGDMENGTQEDKKWGVLYIDADYSGKVY